MDERLEHIGLTELSPLEQGEMVGGDGEIAHALGVFAGIVVGGVVEGALAIIAAANYALSNYDNSRYAGDWQS